MFTGTKDSSIDVVDTYLHDTCTYQSCTEYFGSSVFANSWDRIVLFGLRSSEIFH